MKKSSLLLLTLLLPAYIFAQLVTPAQDGDIYSLSVGNVILKVDASYGARISTFSINGTDILYPESGDFLWGSTFWPSPQSWPWPPPFTALNIEPYSGVIQDNKIVLTSEKDDYNDLVFEKTFYAETSDSSINIEYKIINEGTSTFGVAAWEVTRVPSGGITFFPRGEGSITGAFANQFTTVDGIAWWEHSINDPSGQKMFSDGKDGWFAHVTEDEYLFLKTFEDVPSGLAADNEAEIELWHAGTTTYIELENQSKFENIAAGSSRTYEVTWYLKEIPASIDVSDRSATLAEFAAKVAGVSNVSSGGSSALKQYVSIYPNPASEYIYIQGNPLKVVSLKIYDITGKEVLTRTEALPAQRINVNQLKSGLYFYKAQGTDFSEEGKLIIE